MLRTKLLLFILSGALIFAACSETSTDPGGGGEEPAAPTATINNPGGDGEPLEGEVSFSVDGEAPNGFSEVRVFLDGEQVASAEDPTLPYETTIQTQNYNNGDYNLVAELDVSDPDTMVSDTVSVSLENYLLTMETDGYIEYLKEYNQAGYMFISDPEGNVLREVELTSKSDGVMEFLPPSRLEGGVPEYLNLTFAEQTSGSNNRDALDLSTEVGLEPWSRIYQSRSLGSSDPKREMDLYLHSFDQTPFYSIVATPNYSDINSYVHYNSRLDTTVTVSEGYDDFIITHLPYYPDVQNPVPLYKWEDNLTEMPDSVAYDVSSDFNKMVSHKVTAPSGISLENYSYYMTVAPNSFDQGDMYFTGFPATGYGDANGSSSGVGMWVPEISERSFITYMQARSTSNENVTYNMQTPVGDFPDEFTVLQAETQINNKSMDDLKLSISGDNLDYVSITAENTTDSYYHSWSVLMPDTTKSFVFPKIADSLDSSINNYDRSAFQFTSISMMNYGKIDGYSEYMDLWYSSDEVVLIERYQKYRILTSSGQQKRAPAVAPHKREPVRLHNAKPHRVQEDNRIKEFRGVLFKK